MLPTSQSGIQCMATTRAFRKDGATRMSHGYTGLLEIVQEAEVP